MKTILFIAMSGLMFGQTKTPPVAVRTLPLDTRASLPMEMTVPNGPPVNKGSSLVRRGHTINDPTCPIQLSKFVSDIMVGGASTEFHAFTSGKVTATQDVNSFELRTIGLSPFGEVIASFSIVATTDLAKDVTVDAGRDSVVQPRVGAQLAESITFVRRVRLKSGQVWRCDDAAVLKAALTVTQAVLGSDIERKLDDQ